ncbi:MAG TPA: MATE family efflux transporter [Jatrophihabitans sp.]|jgi:putative MATE family efflux protein|uniref:MATE family efflux transporter n=1 Tax=Jatrophihabitans sp. TaxID=1932789 RepID=UPI002EFC1E0A
MQNDVTEPESRTPGLWQLALPIAADMTLIFAGGVAELYFVSRVGENAVAGYAAMLPLILLGITILRLSAQGAGSVIARYWGAGRVDLVREAQQVAIVVSLVLALALVAVLIPLRAEISHAMGLSGDAAAYGQQYLIGWSIGLALIAVRSTLTGFLAARGDTRTGMWGSAAGTVTAVALNLALLPWTTRTEHPVLVITLVTAFGLVANTSVIARKARGVMPTGVWRERPTGKRVAETARQMARVVIPSTVEPVQFNLFLIALTALVARLGTESLSARAYVVQVTSLTFYYSLSLAIATQIRVSQAYGAEEFDEVRARLWNGRVRAVGGAFVTAVLMWAMASQLIRAFTDDPGVLTLAAPLFAIGLVLEPFRSMNAVTGFALVAVGDGRTVVVASLAITWLLGLPLAYLLAVPMDLGLLGIWIAMAAEEGIRCAVLTLRWRLGHWARTSAVLPS